MKTVGRNLEYARTRIAKMTQEELAECAGVSSRQLRDWEKGKIPTQWGSLASLCEVMNVSAHYILSISLPVSTDALTEEERVILEKYRRLSDDDQTFVDGLVQKLLQANTPRIFGEEE